MTPNEVEALFAELISHQREKTLALAQRIDPSLSGDDLFQPHDHPVLRTHPLFQFEDGVLAGLLSARAALRARRPD
jgi:hypothetical protein